MNEESNRIINLNSDFFKLTCKFFKLKLFSPFFSLSSFLLLHSLRWLLQELIPTLLCTQLMNTVDLSLLFVKDSKSQDYTD